MPRYGINSYFLPCVPRWAWMCDMPFAGELIQVREDERDWEGAAERLLRGFGLALLVPDVCEGLGLEQEHLSFGWVRERIDQLLQQD